MLGPLDRPESYARRHMARQSSFQIQEMIVPAPFDVLNDSDVFLELVSVLEQLHLAPGR